MTPYGKREIGLILLGGLLATAVVGYFLAWWAVLPALLTLGGLAFFRDPTRHPPAGDNVLVAPADGKIVGIERVRAAAPATARAAVGAKATHPSSAADPIPGDGDPTPGNAGTLKVTIFLSVFDVHINRSPCAGRVEATQYRPGRFVNALRSDASQCNECNSLTLAPRPPIPGPVIVRQIAGAIARRIVCAVEPGAELALGQRFGMIKFGSRTELTVPDDPRWEIAVRLGEHVKGGLTVIARLRG